MPKVVLFGLGANIRNSTNMVLRIELSVKVIALEPALRSTCYFLSDI